jgi:uncharacterized protein YeaO (DUF488 family)
LDFQKLLFLYCAEIEETPTYEFIPYRFGGFSLTSYRDRRTLCERGFLHANVAGWKLTELGRGAAAVLPLERARMSRFARDYRHLRGDDLVAETYRRHPYYATRSEIASRVLGTDKLALLAIESARPRQQQPALVTIGYEGRSLEAYLNELLRAGVTTLCDVRRNAFSHKFGFSKGVLENGCSKVGIVYKHLSSLGVPSAHRRQLHRRADYDALFARYKREILPEQQGALREICDWIASGEKVALTCFERSPDLCHRHCVAEQIAATTEGCVVAQHL